jgi:hypothetical protein
MAVFWYAIFAADFTAVMATDAPVKVVSHQLMGFVQAICSVGSM